MTKALETLERLGRYEITHDEQINYTWDLSDTVEYEIVKQALKRNEPMKVLISNNTGMFSGKCGNCGKLFYKRDGRLNFCYSCGQKLDWSDSE